MAAQQHPVEVALAADVEAPVLTPAAATVLLRILRRAHERDRAASGPAAESDQAVA